MVNRSAITSPEFPQQQLNLVYQEGHTEASQTKKEPHSGKGSWVYVEAERAE